MFIWLGKRIYVLYYGHAFHDYLESLLGSKVSISLARALVNYQGKIFTVRKLAEAANVSSSEAAVVVQQLEKYGILRIQPVGRSYLLTLNDKSYILNRILKPIIDAERHTLDELVSLLKKRLDKQQQQDATARMVISAVLFGSVAMKKEREDSDIDLLIISNDFDAASTLASKAKEDVALIFNGRLSPIIMTEGEMKAKKDSSLVRSIAASYILVAGKDLKDVIGDDS
jgi:predicted nucleotidyltransferase/DNA-binding MarR family transcriptional regulator